MEHPTSERGSVQGEFFLRRPVVMMVLGMCISARTRTGRSTGKKHLSTKAWTWLGLLTLPEHYSSRTVGTVARAVTAGLGRDESGGGLARQ